MNWRDVNGLGDVDGPGDVANRTTLRVVERGSAGRHTLGGSPLHNPQSLIMAGFTIPEFQYDFSFMLSG